MHWLEKGMEPPMLCTTLEPACWAAERRGSRPALFEAPTAQRPSLLTSSAARMPTQIMSWLMDPRVPRRWVGEICDDGRCDHINMSGGT